MPIGAGIGAAVGSIGSGLIGASAAKSAAATQAAAAAQARGFAQEQLSPYTEFGKSAMTSLAQLYGLKTPGNPGGADSVNAGWNAFTNLPAYQFPLQQGMLALTRNLNAQGLNNSGAQLRAAQDYGQGLASQYMMTNYVNPLTGFTNMGKDAASSMAGVGASTLMAQGNANASGIIGAANNYSAMFPNALASYGYMSRLPGMGSLSFPGGSTTAGSIGGGLSSYAGINNPGSLGSFY